MGPGQSPGGGLGGEAPGSSEDFPFYSSQNEPKISFLIVCFCIIADEDRITPNDLNLEEISNLRKFDANNVIGMLKEDLFSEAGKQTLLEYLPFSLTADGDTHNESDGKGNGDSEENSSDSQSEGESTDDCIGDADLS